MSETLDIVLVAVFWSVFLFILWEFSRYVFREAENAIDSEEPGPGMDRKSYRYPYNNQAKRPK